MLAYADMCEASELELRRSVGGKGNNRKRRGGFEKFEVRSHFVFEGKE